MITCLCAFFACICFCIIVEVHNYKFILAASISGTISWGIYLILEGTLSQGSRCFIATIIVALLSEIFARIFKTPATLFLIVGILPLVPGGGLYYTMEYLLKGDTHMFQEEALQTMASALAIAVGCSLVSSAFRIKNKK